jgi:hypothetical protein
VTFLNVSCQENEKSKIGKNVKSASRRKQETDRLASIIRATILASDFNKLCASAAYSVKFSEKINISSAV